jgi:hypothetical protein
MHHSEAHMSTVLQVSPGEQQCTHNNCHFLQVAGCSDVTQLGAHVVVLLLFQIVKLLVGIYV